MRHEFFIKSNKQASQDDIRMLIDLFSQNDSGEYADVLSFGAAYCCKKNAVYQNTNFDDEVHIQESGHELNFGKIISFEPGDCVLTVSGEDWAIDNHLARLIHVDQLQPNQLALWNNLDIVPVPEDEDTYTQILAFCFDEIMKDTTKVLWGEEESDETD